MTNDPGDFERRASALKTKIDLGRLRVAMIRTGLPRLPAGDRNIALAGGAEHLFHMFFQIEDFFGL
jgi:hypothetical protein